MKRFLVLGFFALMMFGTSISAQTWQAGANVTATFADGTLTISGTGQMFGYANSTGAPWYWDYRGKIKSLVIEQGVTSIGMNDFYNCDNLASVTIPNSVTSIGTQAFYWCYALTSIVIPNSVTSIHDLAFYDCTALTSVTIPNSVTSIGSNAFYDCYRLTSITVPSSVIGSYAFYNCYGLKSLTISNSVTSIGDYAFQACPGLTSITCLNPDPTNISLGSNGVFNGVNKTDCVLNVPVGSVYAYQAAAQWKDFSHIVGNATGLVNVEIQTLKLFPNPAKDVLNIIAEIPISKVKIYSQDGKMVMQENNFAGVMNVSTLSKGMYVVRVYTQQGIETVQIIKD